MNRTALVATRRQGLLAWLQGPLLAKGQDRACGILALMLFIQITALGGNDQLIQSYASVANIALALIVMNCFDIDRLFWSNISYPFIILGLGLIWVSLPEFATTYDLWAFLPGGRAPRPVPDLQFGAGIRYVSQMALLLCACIIGYKRASLRTLIDWILIFGLINLFIGALLRWVDPEHVWGMPKFMHEFRFTGTFQNANVAGSLCGLLTILAIGRLLSLFDYDGVRHMARMKGWSTFYALTTFAAFGGLLITASRTAIFLTILSILLLLFRSTLVRKAGAKGALVSVAIAAALLFLLLVIGSLVEIPVLARLGQLAPDSAYRAEIYARYWELAKDSPLYGYGLGSFSDVNLSSLLNPAQARAFSYINAAHNQFLQLLMAGGWPFLLSQLVVLGLILKRALGQHPMAETSLLSVWLALLIVGGCSMIDIALTVPAMLSLCVVLLAHMWGRSIRIELDVIAAANRPKSYYSRRKKEKEMAAEISVESLSPTR